MASCRTPGRTPDSEADGHQGEIAAWVNDQLQRAKVDGSHNTLWNNYFGKDEALLLRP